MATSVAPVLSAGSRTQRWSWISPKYRDVTVHLLHSPGGLCGVVLCAVYLVMALFGPYLPFIPDPNTQDLSKAMAPPALFGGTLTHPLGTDQLGRDILSQVVAGARVSMEVGVGAVLASAVVGVSVGLAAGYLGSKTDSLLMSICDVFTALPGRFAGLVLIAVFGPGTGMVVVMIAMTGWTVFARITRGYVKTMRGELFVDAGRLAGAKPRTVVRRHILPNVAPSLGTLVVMEFAAAILSESGYTFLGFGIQPPTTSWGLMIAQGRDYVTTGWWIITFAGAAIMLLVLGATLVAMWADQYSNTQDRDQVLIKAGV